MKSKVRKYSGLGKILVGATLLLVTSLTLAAGDVTLGDLASNMTASFEKIGSLMFAVAYIAGFAFMIAGVFKFKQHKDNPTQIPMGTPIAMVVIGAILVFLPSLLKPAGQTLFGPSGAVAGQFRGQGALVLESDQPSS